jgi:hypothetical protein
MKTRSLFLALSLFVSTNLFAQITLTSADVGSVGDMVFVRNDTTFAGSTTVGNPGINLTWNFQNLSGILQDTIFYISPAAAPSGASFPNANLVSKDGAQFFYFNKSTSGLFIQGLTIDFDTLFGSDAIPVNPPLKFIGFPSTFGTNFTSTANSAIRFAVQDTIAIDTATSFYVDSIRISLAISVVDSINGWGTLQMPGNINLPALRQSNLQTITPNIELRIQNPLWAPNFPFNLLPRWIWIPLPAGIIPSTSFETRTISYYTNGRKYPILAHTLDSAGTILNSQFQTTASIVQGLAQETTINAELQAFPNPSADGMYRLSKPSDFRIFNMAGQEVLRGRLTETIDLRKQPSGNYLLLSDQGQWQKLVRE